MAETEIDDVERCRQARRAIERRCGTLKGLYNCLLRLQTKRSRNIAMGQRLLVEHGTSAVRTATSKRRQRANAARSA